MGSQSWTCMFIAYLYCSNARQGWDLKLWFFLPDLLFFFFPLNCPQGLVCVYL